MSTTPQPLAAVDLAHTWHALTSGQLEIDRAAARAERAVAIPPLAHEDHVSIGVDIEDRSDEIVARVEAPALPPETLRAWATANLLLLRGRKADGTIAERLVRLPAAVDPDAAEIDRADRTFTIVLPKRSYLPVALWQPEA